MKTKKVASFFNLNKSTIANLEQKDLKNLHGGTDTIPKDDSHIFAAVNWSKCICPERTIDCVKTQ